MIITRELRYRKMKDLKVMVVKVMVTLHSSNFDDIVKICTL